MADETQNIKTKTATPAGVQYGGFWVRVLAYLIDSFVLAIPMFVIQMIFGLGAMGLQSGLGGTAGDIASLGASLASSGIMFVIGLLYFGLMESSKNQGTLGKMALSLKVTDYQGNRISFGRAVGRRFAKILSNCLDLPFIQITLGGQNDGELLHGHGYTYSSAQPGLIIKKMCEAENARCIMFFDELDKCLNRDGKESDIMNILIHLIDPMTNSSFQDRFYQEVTFPLNKVIFIFSFNEIPKISSYLLKRLEVININNYVLEDKIKITREHLLKQLCKETGFDFESIVFDDVSLKFLINEYTMEAGVRDLRIKIDNILSKLNVDYLKQKGLFKNDVVYNKENPLIINKELIINIFGHPKNIEKITHPESCVGFTNGLYTSGNEIGGILSIQVVKNNYGNKDNFMIEITGNLKKVMNESVKYAFNCAMNIASDEQKKIFYKNYPQGVFCHFSDASSVKDGPSAGSAIFLTFYSVIVNKKINNKIALTGEIDMFGNIKAIGGVRLKIQGAYKAGIETVFLPEENKNDIEEIIKNKSIEFDFTKKYILVSNVKDIIDNVFND